MVNKVSFKEWVLRFKNVGLLTALVAAALQVLVLLGFKIDVDYIMLVLGAVVNVLIVLGICNNPETDGLDVPLKK